MNKTKLAILWHMHQPPYQRGRVKEAVLPWVWLHGLKDYYDMAALAEKHPGIRLNFNITPSLIDQIDAYVSGTCTDPFFELIANTPDVVSLSDKAVLLDRFMTLSPGLTNGIPAVLQFKEAIRAFGGAKQAAEKFSDQEFLDIQTLFVLAWTGRTLRAHADIDKLLKKQRNYTQTEKQIVLSLGRDLMARTLPLYKELAHAGRLEVSTTPYYHPIMPLLWSSALALEADPMVQLPNSTITAPQEVEEQLRLAFVRHEQVFGEPPAGIWPSEGSVADVLFPLFNEVGVKWLATDEEILKRSMGGVMHPCDPCYSYERHDVQLFFRNKDLSDRIGFLYARWPVEQSVQDFMGALKGLAEKTDENSLVVVALDGENAWEFYPNGGYDFLDALYQAVEAADWVEPVLLKDYAEQVGPRDTLETVATGSWIGGNFSTWIGDPTKNRAWEYLAEAHKAYEQSRLDFPQKAKAAHEYLMKAEASDWFWWFGEGHSSFDEPQFDLVFRENLMAVYRTLGLPVPSRLQTAIETQELLEPVTQPTDYISPAITGREDSFYKWTGSGQYIVAQGAIHKVNPLVKAVNFGFDHSNIYLRLVPTNKTDQRLVNGNIHGELHFVKPGSARFMIVVQDNSIKVLDDKGLPVEGAQAAYRHCLEIKVPANHLIKQDVTDGKQSVEFFVVVVKDGLEIERIPWSFDLEFTFDPMDFDLENWTV